MIRLTLPDGTRIQVEASEITDVEPIAGGSLVHRAAGEPIKVMQDAKTIATRVNAEINARLAEAEIVEPAALTAFDTPTIATADDAAPTSATEEAARNSNPRIRRLKWLFEGRTSGNALAIGAFRKK